MTGFCWIKTEGSASLRFDGILATMADTVALDEDLYMNIGFDKILKVFGIIIDAID